MLTGCQSRLRWIRSAREIADCSPQCITMRGDRNALRQPPHTMPALAVAHTARQPLQTDYFPTNDGKCEWCVVYERLGKRVVLHEVVVMHFHVTTALTIESRLWLTDFRQSRARMRTSM